MKAQDRRKVEDVMRDQHCSTLHHKFRNWLYCCKVNRRNKNVCEIQLPFQIKCLEKHFCSINNFVVVRCIFLEMHFVVITMVIISYVLKKTAGMVSQVV